jgi:hypothetical protein
MHSRTDRLLMLVFATPLSLVLAFAVPAMFAIRLLGWISGCLFGLGVVLSVLAAKLLVTAIAGPMVRALVGPQLVSVWLLNRILGILSAALVMVGAWKFDQRLIWPTAFPVGLDLLSVFLFERINSAGYR